MWSMRSSSIIPTVSAAGWSSPKPYIIGATASRKSSAGRAPGRGRKGRTVFGKETLLEDPTSALVLGIVLFLFWWHFRARVGQREKDDGVFWLTTTDRPRNGVGSSGLHRSWLQPSLERLGLQKDRRPRRVRIRPSRRPLELRRTRPRSSHEPRDPNQLIPPRLQDSNSNGIHATLPGHTGQVTTLKFVPARDAATSLFFVSGDSAGVVRVWKEGDEGTVRRFVKEGNDWDELMDLFAQWSVYAVLTGHTQSISALATMELPGGVEGELLVLTGGSDGVVHSWSVAPAGPSELSVLKSAFSNPR